MNRCFKYQTKGRVLYFDKEHLLKLYKGQLLHSADGGKSWNNRFQIEGQSISDNMVCRNHWASRLLRRGIHHVDVHPTGDIGMVVDKSVAILQEEELVRKNAITGSRPLSLGIINGEFVFGEYRSNPERSSIGIYGFSMGSELSRKAEFTDIRHIHGIYQDPYTTAVWVTTGDNDDEAALYRTDANFNNFEKVLYGSQQTRAIKLLFDEKYIYFGSDAPDEVNYLYRMDKSTDKVERLIEVGSSVFHGCKVGNWLFFSTAVEPSKVNKTKYAEVWASPDGILWKCILKLKKDRLPMRYFQYGQIFFPNGPSDDETLWVSPFGTRFDNRSFALDLHQIDNKFEKIN